MALLSLKGVRKLRHVSSTLCFPPIALKLVTTLASFRIQGPLLCPFLTVHQQGVRGVWPTKRNKRRQDGEPGVSLASRIRSVCNPE